MREPEFVPSFDLECRICGTKPTVVVTQHEEPETELCGVCFFEEKEMVEWEKWNDRP
jgi:hypothetical protein